MDGELTKSDGARRFARTRLGFTLLSFVVVVLVPAASMFVLPLVSPNATVQGWNVVDSSRLAGSVLAGPLAFVSSVPPGWIAAAILAPFCLAYTAFPTRVTGVLTVIGWCGWVLCGLALTFADV